MIAAVSFRPFRRALNARVLRPGAGRPPRLATLGLPIVLALGSPVFALTPLPQQTPQDRASDSSDGKDAPQAAPAPPRTPEVENSGWRRERFAWKKGASKVELTGYFQEDLRFFDWEVVDPSSSRKQAKEHELRRFRLGSKAQLGRTLVEFQFEPRHLAPGVPHLKLLAGTYSFSKALNVRAGFFKLPGSREFNALTNNTDFVDRSMIATRIVPERDWGLTAAGVHGRFEYLAGAFMGDGYKGVRRAGPSGAARAAVNLPRGFQLSGSFLQGRVTADPVRGIVPPVAKGAFGQTATGFTFWSRPHVNGMRRTLSTSLSYTNGPFRFLGEYLEQREERLGQSAIGEDLPDVLGHGVSAQASYLLVGQRKGVLVEPRTSLFQGGPGAVELVARVETLKFDDTGAGSLPVTTGSRAANLAPAGALAVEAGVNYWASFFMKLQATAMWERYDDPKTAPVPGRTGAYFSILARIQFMFQ